MAHADYDCCARCDSKLSYNSWAEAKEEVCGECVVDLFTLTGKRITNPEALVAYIEDEGSSLTDLRSLGIRPCYYGNPVDAALRARGIEVSR